MNYEIKKTILDKIKEYGSICLFRHTRNDGDCVGATKGLKEIIKASFPEKSVYVIDAERAQYLAFLGTDDEEISDEAYAASLGIVLDTATADRISNKKFELCRELIKIDHHIPVSSYGSLQWVEEHYSSCCEMIAEFYDTFKDELTLTKEAALYLYTGMVTDSGRFKYEGVSGDTLRRAAVLLDAGIDTESLYANLYLDDFSYLKFKAAVYEKMQITDGGVAYIFVDREMQEKFKLTNEQASASVSCLDGIRGAIVWLAFIENTDGSDSIRVRLRSRFVTVNQIAEKYHGGGHACASGATVYSTDEMNALIADADAWVKEYKNTHEGWL